MDHCKEACGSQECGYAGAEAECFCGSCVNKGFCIGGQCTCQADCEGKECGSDGCQGECGDCNVGTKCVDNFCIVCQQWETPEACMYLDIGDIDKCGKQCTFAMTFGVEFGIFPCHFECFQGANPHCILFALSKILWIGACGLGSYSNLQQLVDYMKASTPELVTIDRVDVEIMPNFGIDGANNPFGYTEDEEMLDRVAFFVVDKYPDAAEGSLLTYLNSWFVVTIVAHGTDSSGGPVKVSFLDAPIVLYNKVVSDFAKPWYSETKYYKWAFDKYGFDFGISDGNFGGQIIDGYEDLMSWAAASYLAIPIEPSSNKLQKEGWKAIVAGQMVDFNPPDLVLEGPYMA